MKHPFLAALAALIIFAGHAFSQDTYWITEDDSTGWVPMNVWVDLPVSIDGTQIQRAAIGRMALNTVIAAGPTTLTHTNPRGTWSVSFSAAAADSMLGNTVGPATAAEILVSAIAAQLVISGELDSVTVKKTGPGGTATIVEY